MPDETELTADPEVEGAADAATEQQAEAGNAEGEQGGESGPQGAEAATGSEGATPGTDAASFDKSTVAAEKAQGEAAPKAAADISLDELPETFRKQVGDLLEMKKNYDKRGAEWNREHQARLKAEKDIEQYRQIHPDPSKLREEAEAARRYQESIQQRPPWDPHHPHHAHFTGLLQRAQEIGTRVQEIQSDPEIPVEVKQRLIQNEHARLAPNEREHLQAFHRATEAHRLNPIGHTMAMLEQQAASIPSMVRSEIERYQAEMSARSEVQEFARQNPEALTKNAELLQSVLTAPNAGKQFDVARMVVEMKTKLDAISTENAALRAKLGDAAKTVVMAEAQIEATTRKATRTSVHPAGAGRTLSKDDLSKALRDGNLIELLDGGS